MFTPGVPVVLDTKGQGDLSAGDLAVVRTGRGRARVESVVGPASHPVGSSGDRYWDVLTWRLADGT